MVLHVLYYSWREKVKGEVELLDRTKLWVHLNIHSIYVYIYTHYTLFKRYFTSAEFYTVNTRALALA
jgi:hypothetical protein